MTPPTDELRTELLERIRTGDLPDADFDRLARAVFRHQVACNPPYRAFCERRGVTAESIGSWREIPAAPTEAFKAVPLVCGDPSQAVAVFRTSGTTAGSDRRGEHHFPDLTLYDAALRSSFAAHLLPDGLRPRILALVPTPGEAPDSSLAHMIGAVMESHGAPGSRHLLHEGRIDLDGVREELHRAEGSGEPVCVLGTSFAFVHLLDGLEERGGRFRLPSGSRLMDTGGFKGRSREVTREALYAALEAALGIPVGWCVNEYGMTEMSSQFYDGVVGRAGEVPDRVHRGPPWVRTAAVDPETLTPLPDGETGVLRHWDLANLHSVVALQTADLGVVTGGGFRVLGRARGAEARGCSIAADELLSAARGEPG